MHLRRALRYSEFIRDLGMPHPIQLAVQKNGPLLRREFCQGEIDSRSDLPAFRHHVRRITAFGRDIVRQLRSPIWRAKIENQVHQNPVDPGSKRGFGFEILESFPGLRERLGNKIMSLVLRTRQLPRQAQQPVLVEAVERLELCLLIHFYIVRHRASKKVYTHFSMASKKYQKVSLRSGTPPFVVPTTDGKLIEEFFGASNGHGDFSVAHMVAPPGWGEPAQTPDFDEITIIIRGRKKIEVDGDEIILGPGETLLTKKGARVTYSNPFDEEVEYWAVCMPAFSVEKAFREDN